MGRGEESENRKKKNNLDFLKEIGIIRIIISRNANKWRIICFFIRLFVTLQAKNNFIDLDYDSNSMGEPPRRGKEISGAEED